MLLRFSIPCRAEYRTAGMPNKDRSGILARWVQRAIPDLGVFVRQWHRATRRAEEREEKEEERGISGFCDLAGKTSSRKAWDGALSASRAAFRSIPVVSISLAACRFPLRSRDRARFIAPGFTSFHFLPYLYHTMLTWVKYFIDTKLYNIIF